MTQANAHEISDEKEQINNSPTLNFVSGNATYAIGIHNLLYTVRKNHISSKLMKCLVTP